MTEQRQKLLDRFDKWLDSKPRKQIISAQCANIAEEYAEEQLRLHGVVKSLNASLQIGTKVKWKHINGEIHKIVGEGFYQIKDDADGYIWQAFDDGSIKEIA